MKRKPSPDWAPEESPTFWINHAARLIQRRFDDGLRPLGMTFAAMPVAMALKDGPRQQRALTELMRVEQPTMATLLTRMERDGLVKREPHPDDGRASLFSLTSRAEAQLGPARQALVEAVDEALEGVSRADRERLVSVLKRVVENLRS